MKAAVCRAFGAPLSIEEVALAAPRAGEVRVKVSACAICHSDISYMRGEWGGALPAVYGHEAAGTVAEVGPEVAGVKPGDRVVVTLVRHCGHCGYCADGLEVQCEEVFPLDRASPLQDADGRALHQEMRTGAFAEEVTVHASQVVVVPHDLPADRAALLACGVVTGYGAVANAADLRPGDTAVVIGAGGVGLNSIQTIALREAALNIALDTSDAKLEAAKAFGASHGVNPAKEDAAARVLELTGGRGVDYVFVTVGAKAAFDQAPAMLARGGALVLVGMPPVGVLCAYEPTAFAARNQRILGTKMGSTRIQADIPYLAELYRNGRFKLDELITARYALDQVNEAVAAAERGEALRNVIMF